MSAFLLRPQVRPTRLILSFGGHTLRPDTPRPTTSASHGRVDAVAYVVLGLTVLSVLIALVAVAFTWAGGVRQFRAAWTAAPDRKSTRLNSSHSQISYAV